jgi:hypothetical protein
MEIPLAELKGHYSTALWTRLTHIYDWGFFPTPYYFRISSASIFHRLTFKLTRILHIKLRKYNLVLIVLLCFFFIQGGNAQY